MKKIYLLIVIQFCSLFLFSQRDNDTIITKTNDTILCNITQISKDYLHYATNINVNDSNVTGYTIHQIEIADVIYYSFFSKSKTRKYIINHIDINNTDSLELLQKMNEMILTVNTINVRMHKHNRQFMKGIKYIIGGTVLSYAGVGLMTIKDSPNSNFYPYQNFGKGVVIVGTLCSFAGVIITIDSHKYFHLKRSKF
jgi:hypothetical protein